MISWGILGLVEEGKTQVFLTQEEQKDADNDNDTSKRVISESPDRQQLQ